MIRNYKTNRWGIVLAGGEGTRLKQLVQKLYGYHRPKQFCTIIGTRSMVRHTLDRVKILIPHEQIITVITRNHLQYAIEEIFDQPADTIIVQPYARETSAGILLPLLKINHWDPDSIVSIFPSDHFINEENRFMEYVREANEFVEHNLDSIIMLGIAPDQIESGYGWIEPGNKILQNGNKKIHHVRGFWEKPDKEKAEILWYDGCLLNTFVLIGRSTTFIKHMQKCIPEVFNAFEPIRETLGSSMEDEIIGNTFKHIPAINFSHFVLENISDHLHVMEISNVYWSDWGEEERIKNDIKKLDLSFREFILA